MPPLSRLVSALTGIALLSTAFAGELRVPESFDVLQVNGERYGVTMAREKTLVLPAGRQVIVLEYDVIFDASFGDSHDRVQSTPFAMVFELAEDSRLQLLDPALRNSDEAKRYAKAPTVQLRDAAQRAVAVQVVPVRELSGELQALLPSVASAPTAAVQAPAPTASAPPSPGASTSPTAASAVVPAPDAAQMLQYWWQQATPEQRAAFLRQIGR